MSDKYSYLTIKEFKKRIKEDEPVMRSCWNCNTAHKYLKKADYIIWCFDCEKLYLKGKPLVVIENEEN